MRSRAASNSIWRPAAEHRGQVLAQVARVHILGIAIQPVHHQHHVHQQDFFVRPVVVDRRLAHAGGLRNGIHAGGVNAALAEQLECGAQDTFMSFLAAWSGHGLDLDLRKTVCPEA